MKVTSRELSLLIVLGAVFLIYILYTFLFNPLLGELAIAKDSLESARIQKQTVESHAETIPQLIQQQEQVAKEAEEKVKGFLPDLNQDLITTFFSSTVAAGGPNISNINHDSLSVVNLDSLIPAQITKPEYMYGGFADTAKQDPEQTEDVYNHPAAGDNDASKSVLLRQVSVGFGLTTYEQAIQQIKRVESLERTILLSSFVLSSGEGGLQGNAIYSFYGLDKLTDEDKGLPTTNLSEGIGRANPFI